MCCLSSVRDYFNIIDFSETVERNSMKFDRNVSNPLPNLCFWADWKTKNTALASDWPRHFWLLLWNCWTEIQRKLDRKQALNIHYQVRVLGPIGNQDGHPGLWLAETFFTSSLQRLNRIQRNLMGTRSQHFYQFRVQWWFVYPDTFVPGQKVPDKRVFRITESPIGPDMEIGSRTFVRTSEISGLSEPGLTNRHCIWGRWDTKDGCLGLWFFETSKFETARIASSTNACLASSTKACFKGLCPYDVNLDLNHSSLILTDMQHYQVYIFVFRSHNIEIFIIGFW